MKKEIIFSFTILIAFLTIQLINAPLMNNPNIPLVQPPINYSLIPTVNNSMFLNGFPSSYFYPASNPFGFISSYTETDPICTENLTNYWRVNTIDTRNYYTTGNTSMSYLILTNGIETGNIWFDGAFNFVDINIPSTLYMFRDNDSYWTFISDDTRTKFQDYVKFNGGADFTLGLSSTSASVSGNIAGSSNIYTTGAGDNIWAGAPLLANANFQAWATGEVRTDADNIYYKWGEGQDAGIMYNDTDMIINPALVGSGKVYVLSNLLAYNLTTNSIIPNITNIHSVGTSTNRYLNGYFSGLNVNGDINITGNTTLNGNLNQTSGNATINMIYGEMYCKNDTGCGVIDLVTADVYVAMKNQTAGNNNGFILNGASNLTAQVSGLYQANAKASISAGTPAGDFGMKLYLNETGQNNCYDNFKVGADHLSMVVTCLVRINAGQNVSIRFDDHNSPVTDITVYASNLNLVRIGN